MGILDFGVQPHTIGNMRTLLVLAIVAFVNAEDEAAAPAAVLPFPYYGLGHPYAYAPQVVHQPIQYKYVPKEVPVEVKSFEPELVETGCKNSFGNPVPCHISGLAKRSADEEAAPAAVPLVYGGSPYAHPLVTVAEPKVHEIEVPTITYKHVVEKVPIQ